MNFSKIPHHVVSYIFRTPGMESLRCIIELGSLTFSDVTIFEQLLRSNLVANSISRFLSRIKSVVISITCTFNYFFSKLLLNDQ